MINYLVMDVDGTLTDGKIYIGKDGEVFKAFNIKDGLGIHEILPKLGIEPIIITGRKSDIVVQRCKEIGIKHLFQGISDKVECLTNFLSNNSSSLNKVAYIGDDLNDFNCMKLIKENGGLIACPSDACKCLKENCDIVCNMTGGNGAVREFIEWLEQNNR